MNVTIERTGETMQVLQTVYKVFSMLGGLAIFMVGMKLMGESLETIAGNEMNKMFEKVSNNRFKGFLIGLGVTSVIQSSSATSVMLVGFVNVGFLTLIQATPILLGAIVGTTVTAQISSLSAFNITAILSLVAAVGAVFYLFAKNDRAKHVGAIFLGFGMLFIGLSLMSSSMKSIAFDDSGAPTAFAAFMLSFENPFLGVISMVLFTAIIQSSSAATGVLVALATAGVLVNPISTMYMVLGTHIGTCITAILASIGTTINARRTAIINLLVNIFGTIVWIIILLFFANPIASVVMNISGKMERFVANFHTISNLFVALFMLPLVKPMVKLTELLVKENKRHPSQNSSKRLYYLDERIMHTPSLAVAQSLAEVKNMADLSYYNLMRAIDMVLTEDDNLATEIIANEEKINYLNLEITNYLIKFASLDLSAKDDHIIGSLFHVVSDIERIGDYAENVMKFANRMKKEEQTFSSEAKSEIEDAKELLQTLYKDTMAAFMKRDKSLLKEVDATEHKVDQMKALMQKMHIMRLNNGTCTAEAGAVYLSLSSQLERVADHMTNIAYSIVPYKDKLIMGDIKAK